MTDDHLLERIAHDPRRPEVGAILRESGTPVARVLELLGSHGSVEAVLAATPGLTREDVLACLAHARRLVLAPPRAGDAARDAAASREAEQRFQAIFDDAPVMMSLTDLETGRFNLVNAEALRVSGYRREELVGRTSVEIGWVSPPDRERMLAAFRAEGRAMGLDIELRRKDGQPVQCLYFGQLVTFSGRPQILSISQDITGRKQMEDALRDSEERFRLLAETSTDMISRHAPDGTYRYASPACRALLGYAPEDLVGHSAYAFVLPSDHETVRRDHVLVSGGEAIPTTVYRIRRKDGSALWLETTSRTIRDPSTGEVTEIHAATRDVSDRKRAEAALQARTALLDQILESAPIGFAVYAPGEPRPRFVSARYEEILGVERGALTSMDQFYSVVFRDPALREELRARVAADLDSGDPTRMHWDDIPITLASGEVRYVTSTAIPLPEHGLMVSTVQDVTARVGAQEALRDGEAILRSAVESAPIVLFTLDQAGVFRLSTGAGLRGLGLKPGEVVGLRHWDVYPELSEANARARAALAGEASAFELEARGITWDLRYEPLRDAAGRVKGMVGTAIDVTERRRAEAERARLQQQLIHAQKMEAVGQLAGGVAHDFNNILTAILANVDLVLEEPLPGGVRAALHELTADARRAASLTRQLLMFSRKQLLQRRATELNQLVGDLLRMLRRLIGEQVVLEHAPSPEPLWLHADGGMLEQAVMNLVVNARDAMPGGGRVAIRLAPLELLPGDTGRHPQARPGRFACLEVADSGHGMDPETARHAFEPFFTTKEVGKGTGLGLATVHGIVQQHEGWVEVETAAGQGTTFRVILPLGGDRAPERPEPHADPRPGGARERVLVVEDDASVQRVLVRTLERLGYDVRAASTGAEALERWREGGDADLVLTDVTMPGGVSGLELADQLLRARPGLAVIVMSGYSPELTDAQAARRLGVVHLSKPLDAGVLARTVRELLDRRRG